MVTCAHFRFMRVGPWDPGSGKSVTERGMVSRVVKDLTLPFSGSNHVLYMDNFFTVSFS